MYISFSEVYTDGECEGKLLGSGSHVFSQLTTDSVYICVFYLSPSICFFFFFKRTQVGNFISATFNMEKLLKPYDKEFMRMAILKHEETFKEQVYELHRLYHIQKIMMKSSIAKMRPKGQMQEMSWINLNNEDGDGDDCDEDGVLEIVDESQIELTLGPTRLKNNRTRKRGGGDQAVLTSDSGGGLSFSSSSTGSNHVMNKTRSFSSNRSGIKNSSSSVVINVGEEQMMRQDERLKLPPWLFQVLSLNMTS